MPTLKTLSATSERELAAAVNDPSLEESLQRAIKNAVVAIASGDYVSAEGSAYTLTTAAAGVTGATATVVREGTYKVEATVRLDGAGLTTTNQTATVKVRKTSGTPADIPNTSTTYGLPVVTTQTLTVDTMPIGPVVVTLAAGDVLQVFANISAVLGAGTVSAAKSSLLLTRLY